MLNRNISIDPNNLNMNPVNNKIPIKLRNGLSLLKRCISTFLFVKNIIPVERLRKANKPIINCRGCIILIITNIARKTMK